MELLVAMTILSMLVLILFSIFNQTTMAWQASEKQIDAFREARAALFMLRRDLSGMVLSAKAPLAFNQAGATVTAPADTDIGDNIFFLSAQPGGAQESSNKGALCAVGYYVAWSVNDFNAAGSPYASKGSIRSFNLFRYFRGGGTACANLKAYLDPATHDPANPGLGLQALYSGVLATASGDDVVARNVTRLGLKLFRRDSAGVLNEVAPGVVTEEVSFLEVTLKTVNNDTAARLGATPGSWKRGSGSQTAELLLNANEQAFRTRIRLAEARP